MILSLAGEGLFLLFSGFPFPGLPLPLYAVGATWIVECLATVFYTRRPYYALAIGWVMLILTSASLQRNPNLPHTVGSFLYQHSLELLFIVSSHLGYFMVFRQRNTGIARSLNDV
jgi:hypothetical protein